MTSFLNRIVLLALVTLGIAPAMAQDDSIDQWLTRAGVNVTRFLNQLGDVRCNEEVQQEKLTAKGKSEERLQSSFEYIVLAQNQGNEPTLFESREAVKQAHSKKNLSLLVTNGFATQLLIFHPYYQSSFTFDRLPDVRVNGTNYIQLHFQHVKGRPTPAALLLRGREYPLSLAGVARIDPQTGAVAHIETELGSSMQDLGLNSFRSEVDYAPVALPQSKSYLLPAVAVVEVNSTKQHWKNVHRFTNYRLFSVSVTESVDVDKLKQKEQ
jgi:hypothetical protein